MGHIDERHYTQAGLDCAVAEARSRAYREGAEAMRAECVKVLETPPLDLSKVEYSKRRTIADMKFIADILLESVKSLPVPVKP